jgi:RimJ/RimL family protein N-acetyltransferase
MYIQLMKKQFELKNGERIIIRHVEESDINGVWNNFNEVIEEGVYLPIFFPVRSQYEKQSWFDVLKREKEICLIAKKINMTGSNAVIGQVEVSNLEWDAATHVGSLGIIVKNKYRDQGLGFRLIDSAIKESKRLNKKQKLILSCFSNNERALYLYKKIGFKVIGRRNRQFYMDSKYFDEILMELWIDDYLQNDLTR